MAGIGRSSKDHGKKSLILVPKYPSQDTAFQLQLLIVEVMHLVIHLELLWISMFY